MALPRNSALLLKILKEDGIDALYIPRNRPQPASALSPAAKSSSSLGSDKRKALLELREKVTPCVKCPELVSTRTQTVFGGGSVNAKLMFVGEAPGADEDEQGLPFVGRAGQLLTKIIESIGFTREQVFIANVLKCRPPGNRQPTPDEIANCSPFLKAQIEIIQPQIICALGSFAAQTLLQTTVSISQLRGKFFDQGNHRVICTYHPAYLLRNPGEKRAVWEDMKMIKRELEKSA